MRCPRVGAARPWLRLAWIAAAVVAAAANHDAHVDRTLGEEGESGANAAVVRTVIFMALSLTLASLVEALPSAVLRLFPQSVLVLLLFLVCGLIILAVEGNAGSFASFVHGIELSPEGLQLIFLPPLIFSELFKSNVHVFMRVLSQTLLLAFPGVLICTGLIALFPLYMLPTPWSAYEALAFGGMLSATDPVAVIAILHDLGASKKLSAIISGESVLNDGSAIVVVTLFLQLQAAVPMSPGDIVAFVFRECLGSLALGLGFGLVQMALFPLLANQPTPLVTLTLSLPYLAFACALVGGMSGVLALVPLGLMANAFGKGTIVGPVAERMEEFWNVAEFLANSVLFALSGLVVADDLLVNKVSTVSFGYLVLLYVVIVVSRLVAIAMLFPALRRLGPGMDLREATVAWWGGLRGAVGLTLALSIRGSPGVSPAVGNQVTFYMGGIVALTLLVNATTSAPLVRRLALQNEPNARIIEELERQFKELAASSLAFAGGDPADVAAALGMDAAEDKEPPQQLEAADSSIEMQTGARADAQAELQAKRRHFLLAQAVTYAGLRDRRIIERWSWYVLVNSIDVALDQRESALDQWNQILRSTPAKMLAWVLRNANSPVHSKLAALLTTTATGIDGDAGAVAGAAAAAGATAAAATANEDGESDADAAMSTARWKQGPSVQLADFALFTYAEVAYGYLRAHQVSRAALTAFAARKDRLRATRNRVWRESLQGCVAAAGFLNAIKELRPKVLLQVKAKQMAVSIRYELLSKCLLLADLGLLEQAEVHSLLHTAEAIWQAARRVELKLVAEDGVSPRGDFELHEDLYPFPQDAFKVKHKAMPAPPAAQSQPAAETGPVSAGGAATPTAADSAASASAFTAASAAMPEAKLTARGGGEATAPSDDNAHLPLTFGPTGGRLYGTFQAAEEDEPAAPQVFVAQDPPLADPVAAPEKGGAGGAAFAGSESHELGELGAEPAVDTQQPRPPSTIDLDDLTPSTRVVEERLIDASEKGWYS